MSQILELYGLLSAAFCLSASDQYFNVRPSTPHLPLRFCLSASDPYVNVPRLLRTFNCACSPILQNQPPTPLICRRNGPTGFTYSEHCIRPCLHDLAESAAQLVRLSVTTTILTCIRPRIHQSMRPSVLLLGRSSVRHAPCRTLSIQLSHL